MWLIIKLHIWELGRNRMRENNKGCGFEPGSPELLSGALLERMIPPVNAHSFICGQRPL